MRTTVRGGASGASPCSCAVPNCCGVPPLHTGPAMPPGRGLAAATGAVVHQAQALREHGASRAGARACVWPPACARACAAAGGWSCVREAAPRTQLGAPPQRVILASVKASWLFLFFLSFLSFLSFTASWLGARSAAQRLRALSHTCAAFARHGSSVRIRLPPPMYF
jgi:hypothetical protein